MTEAIEVYNQYLKGKTAHEVWTTPRLEIVLAAVMTKIGQPLDKRGCLTCISDALIALNKMIYEGMETAAKYKLKAVTIGKLGFALSNDNLTDKYARLLLKRWPGHIQFFAKYPKDWRVDCGLDKPKLQLADYVEINDNTPPVAGVTEEIVKIPKRKTRKTKSE